MSNFSDWMNWVIARNESNSLPLLADVVGLIDPTVGQNTPPDADGLVKISTSNPDYENLRHDIAEIADSLPAGSAQRWTAELNQSIAFDRYNTGGLMGVCLETEAYQDKGSGATAYRIKQPQVQMPGTHTWPPIVKDGFDLSKVSGVIAYCNQLKVRTTSDGEGFGPK